uniref:Uncharacterized protein n=1 Tax=Cannabis sativa TaxID=3483 RepID=A0A803PCJ2_CANSA
MKSAISDAQSKVEDLHYSVHCTANHDAAIKHSEAILDDLLQHEEIYWQQRGDKKTLKADLAAIIRDYFAQTFTASSIDELALTATINTNSYYHYFKYEHDAPAAIFCI